VYFNSRISALVLGIFVAVVTTAAMFVAGLIDTVGASVCFLVSFSISFLLVYASLEFLVFRELYKIQKMLEGLNNLKPISRKFKRLLRLTHLKKSLLRFSSLPIKNNKKLMS
jgi:hypothetical protein